MTDARRLSEPAAGVLTFGVGQHACLGVHLAHRELEMVLTDCGRA